MPESAIATDAAGNELPAMLRMKKTAAVLVIQRHVPQKVQFQFPVFNDMVRIRPHVCVCVCVRVGPPARRCVLSRARARWSPPPSTTYVDARCCLSFAISRLVASFQARERERGEGDGSWFVSVLSQTHREALHHPGTPKKKKKPTTTTSESPTVSHCNELNARK